jgi:hypothetical protein
MQRIEDDGPRLPPHKILKKRVTTPEVDWMKILRDFSCIIKGIDLLFQTFMTHQRCSYLSSIPINEDGNNSLAGSTHRNHVNRDWHLDVSPSDRQFKRRKVTWQ